MVAIQLVLRYAQVHMAAQQWNSFKNEYRHYVCPVASAALANCLIQATRRKISQVASSDLVHKTSKTSKS